MNDLLLVVVVGIVSIFLHEIGHIIMIYIMGFKVQSIYLSRYYCYKQSGRIHINRCEKINSVTIIPQLNRVKNEKDFAIYAKKYSYVLWIGPFISLSLLVLGILGTIIGTEGISKGYRMLVWINFFIFVNCLRKTEEYVGDIIAGLLVKNKKYFFFSYALRWHILDTNTNKCNIEIYCNTAINYIMKLNDTEIQQNYILSMIYDLLFIYEKGMCKKSLPERVNKKICHIINNVDNYELNEMWEKFSLNERENGEINECYRSISSM